MKRIIFSLFLISAVYTAAFADEGMWMTDKVDKRTRELCDCVVAIDFMGTGSLVSPEGLVITNHHVAYGDVFALSDKEHNFLEDGFWPRCRNLSTAAASSPA